ncbi:MAG TPA: hypothetical protein VFC38_07110 [Stellaceae bacterium]|nr:hypothetical protein [Stellaceae bacterium]
MSRYEVKLMRKASSTKELFEPVRTFGFDAQSDTEAMTLTKMMNIFPGVDDCDVAMLFTHAGECLRADWRNA